MSREEKQAKCPHTIVLWDADGKKGICQICGKEIKLSPGEIRRQYLPITPKMMSSEKKNEFIDKHLGKCVYTSFYTSPRVGGYSAKCEGGSIDSEFIPSLEVIDKAEAAGMKVSLAGGRWGLVGRKGYGEKVTPEEARRLVEQLETSSKAGTSGWVPVKPEVAEAAFKMEGAGPLILSELKHLKDYTTQEKLVFEDFLKMGMEALVEVGVIYASKNIIGLEALYNNLAIAILSAYKNDWSSANKFLTNAMIHAEHLLVEG